MADGHVLEPSSSCRSRSLVEKHMKLLPLKHQIFNATTGGVQRISEALVRIDNARAGVKKQVLWACARALHDHLTQLATAIHRQGAPP